MKFSLNTARQLSVGLEQLSYFIVKVQKTFDGEICFRNSIIMCQLTMEIKGYSCTMLRLPDFICTKQLRSLSCVLKSPSFNS